MRRPLAVLIGASLALLLLALVMRGGAHLYTEFLWFRHVGFPDVFETRLLAGGLIRVGAAVLGAGIVAANLWLVVRQLGPVHLRRRYGNIEIAEKVPRRHLIGGIGLIALLTGLWLSGAFYTPAATLGVLGWLRHVSFGIADPLFGNDAAFYIFTLPVIRRLLAYLLVVALWSGVLVLAGYLLIGVLRIHDRRLFAEPRAVTHLAVLAAGVIVLIAIRYWLGRYDLALRGTGFGGIVGYVDVHVRIPVRLGLTLLGFAFAAAVVYGARRRAWLPPVIAAGALVVAALGAGWIYPGVVQSVHVEPNQLAREATFIRWHIEATRTAYGLDRIRRERLLLEPRPLRWSSVESDLERVPLWDRDPLHAAIDAREARREYYHFPDVHFDRYGPPGNTWPVAIAAREFRREGLPPDARTWQTLHLNPEYVRGRGAVVVPAASTLEDPDLWVSEFDPVHRDPAAPPELEIREESIYFGETTDDYIVLGAALAANGRTTPRTGDTAVPLDSFLRVFAFAIRFGDHNLLFARELTRDSRLLFIRSVRDRLTKLAPFLIWDPDPYPVIYEGRIVWLVDGYAATTSYPLAASYSLENVGRLRYARSSVKAVVDAVTGETAIFVLEPDEPIVRTFRRLFPTLFSPLEATPDALRAHWRYPPALLRMQADMLRTYHLERPEPFYAGEDVWEVPDERGAQGAVLKAYRPVYTLARLPNETQREFVALFPFMARGRPVMTALLAARNDAPNYGELVLYEMPRDQQVRGLSVIESLIRQDPAIASQISLWRQTSDVHHGQIRIVPIEGGILYVQPLFLSAHTNPVPQLARVIVSDGARVRMAPTLAAAVTALAGEPDPIDGPPGAGLEGREHWAQDALRLLEQANRHLRDGDWSAFGARWQELQRLLRRAADSRPRP